jgi:hypothetical protein
LLTLRNEDLGDIPPLRMVEPQVGVLILCLGAGLKATARHWRFSVNHSNGEYIRRCNTISG